MAVELVVLVLVVYMGDYLVLEVINEEEEVLVAQADVDDINDNF
jgi:hypothetical protein